MGGEIQNADLDAIPEFQELMKHFETNFTDAETRLTNRGFKQGLEKARNRDKFVSGVLVENNSEPHYDDVLTNMAGVDSDLEEDN